MKARFLLAIVAAFLLSSCAAQTFHMRGMHSSAVPTYETSQPFFVYGIGQEQNVMVKSVCGQRNVVAVGVQQTFLDVFLSVLTGGLYTPRTAKVWCK